MMEVSTSLQIPDSAMAGSSRQPGYSRPVSVSVHPSSTSSPQAPTPASRQRASHQVVSTSQQESQVAAQNEQPAYRDVYAHPAAIAYAAAHPRRTIPKFGPYLLLQTLGEGEFGKVKLGLHSQWGEEVAVKLIRRGNIDSTVRMSKVEREIEVLRTLKHPNIVRLYDVIETDKYIGIILEYASGGELFDHILAHRYLKEKDACKLFSQLISGVWYIHQKKIVHRDLKLENLLLDRHRNVIITDFGFANRFEHRADDLMQTSCGSPCYAAPELVISEGLYVGSAVDIWSCGVILYAMLAGYLPFDDDPDNPDGDNINLLYKYIVTTPLTFPSHISPEARDLLGLMLVADPVKRADLNAIMRHEWLAPYHHLFLKAVEDLERAAMEQHQMKRMAYQRQMRTVEGGAAANGKGMSRSQSARPEATPGGGSSRSRSHQVQQIEERGQPEYLYETSADQAVYSSPPPPSAAATRRGYNSVMVSPTTANHPVIDDDPFAPVHPPTTRDLAPPPTLAITEHVGSAGQIVTSPLEEIGESRRDEVTEREQRRGEPVPPSSGAAAASAARSSPESQRKKGGFRHTIQVEYGQDGQDQSQSRQGVPATNGISPNVTKSSTSPERSRSSRKPPVNPEAEKKPLPAVPPISDVVTSSSARQGLDTLGPASGADLSRMHNGTGGSGSSKQSGHRKGLSVDKLTIGKIFNMGPDSSGAGTTHVNGSSSRVPSERSTDGDQQHSRNGTFKSYMGINKRPSTLQTTSPTSDAEANGKQQSSSSTLLSPSTDPSAKKSRRNTLTVMVEPISRTIKNRTRGRVVTTDTPSKDLADMEKTPSSAMPPSGISHGETEAQVTEKSTLPPPTPSFGNVSNTDIGSIGLGMPASTSKARKVMQWFRSKSKGRESLNGTYESDSGLLGPSANQMGEATPSRGALPSYRSRAGAASSSSTINAASPAVQVYVTTPNANRAPIHPQRTASADTSYGLAERVRSVVASTPNPKGLLRVHHGAVDQTTITTRAPPEVMKHVKDILENMGVEIQIESDYKYRCIRHKRKKSTAGLGGNGGSGSLAAFNVHGTAASNGVDKRGLPIPSPSTFSGGGMLRGLLMRRQSSQVSSIGQQSLESDSALDTSISPEPITPNPLEAVYGDRTQDVGDEVRFSVELTRLDRLNDTYSLDIRRLKGNLRSYKFLYDTLRDRADLQR